jgi:hypothetical protein
MAALTRITLVFISLLLLSSCATTEKYKAILNSLVKETEGQLINSWGPPDSVYENGGRKYLTYIKSRSGYVPGTTPNYQTQIIGNTAYTTSYGGSSGHSYTKRCKTTFTISGRSITNWRHEGNACHAR